MTRLLEVTGRGAVVCAALGCVGLGVLAFAEQPRLGVVVLGLPVALLVAVSPAAGTAFLLLALPLEELGAMGPGGMPTLHKLLGVGVVGAWLLQALVRRQSIRVPAMVLPLVAYVVWGGTSALWSVDPATTVRLTVTLVQLLGLYLLLVNVLDTPAALRRALLAHVAGGVLLAVVGLYLVGEGVLQGGRAAIVVDRQMLVESNALAAALLLPVAICLAGATDRTRGGLERIALAVAGALCTTAILFTLSRAALLGVVAIVLVMSAVRRTLVLLVPAMVLALPGVLLIGPELWQRLVEGVTLADRGAGRVDIWEVGWIVIRHHPLAGVGLGSFPLVYYEYLAQAADVSWRHALAVAHSLARAPHNTYLGTLAELGVVGFVLLLTALAQHLVAAVRTQRRLAGRHPRAAGLLLSGLTGLAAMVVLALGHDVANRKFLWLALALPAIGHQALRVAPARVAPALRRAA
jgi:O-antigen ligase